MFLLHYVGTAWETWDLTPTDAVAAAPLPLYSSTSLVLHAVDALRLYSTYIGGATPLLGIAARVAVYSRCTRSGDRSSTRPYPYLY